MFVVLNENFARLCKDDKFRSWANFGTYPSNVKFYKKKGWAEKKAKCYRGKVVQFQDTDQETYSMNASGDVHVYVENGSRFSHSLPLDNFVIYDSKKST